MTGRGPGLLRIGFLTDGVFKLLVAAAYLAARPLLGTLLDVPAWVLVLTAVAVALSGVAETVFALSSGAGTHIRFLVGYDSGWVLVTVLAVLLGPGAGGWIWLFYQVVASALMALAFSRGVIASTAGAPKL